MARGNLFPSKDSDSAMETAHRFRIINLQSRSRALLLGAEIMAKKLSMPSESMFLSGGDGRPPIFYFPTQHLPGNQTELEQH